MGAFEELASTSAGQALRLVHWNKQERQKHKRQE